MDARDHSFSALLRTTQILLLILLGTLSVFPQSQAGKTDQNPAKSPGTIHVQVGLVETDVTVYDKQGRFVDGLKPDQFRMLVDGKPQPLSFLELVTTGSLKSAPLPAKSAGKGVAPPSPALQRRPTTGRTLLFFIDDWHLSTDSNVRTRDALSHLVDTMMGPNDRAAIFTSTRQLGFLQQLTDNKSILQRAISRLQASTEPPRDLGRPLMNEAQALEIEQGDPDVLGAFVDGTITAEGLPDRTVAAEIVRQRAAVLAQISAEMTARTLGSLRSVVQSCAALPGHKLIFFLSDGFVLQQQRDDVAYRIRQVTDAAAAAEVVIYTFDTRGLVVGLPNAASPTIFMTPQPPRGSAAPADPAGRLERSYNDVFAAQDGLSALASDTGGHFIKNTNGIELAIAQSLEETSHYYLLGWHVDPDRVQPGHYSRLQISIDGQPDFKVHLRQNQIMLSKIFPKEKGHFDNAALGKPGLELAHALEYPWPIEDLPTYLYAGYVYLPDKKQYVLDISLLADVEGADASTSGADTRIDLLGIVANRDGAIVGSFEISPGKPADPSGQPKLVNHEFSYSRLIPIEPGIYQVRVAARDPITGHIGSAHQWVEIPLTSPGKPQLGTIFLEGELPIEAGQRESYPSALARKQLNAKRLVAGASHLSFLVQIFNAPEAPVVLQAKVYQGNQVVLQSPPQTFQAQNATGSNPDFVESEIPLKGLTTGAYVLELGIKNSSSGTPAAMQSVNFWVR